MKIYFGWRTKEGCCAKVYDSDKGSILRDLDPRLDLRSHSPTGFEWGYPGSGPAQLALALLADACDDDDVAREFLQGFQREVVQHLARECWILWDSEVMLSLVGLMTQRLTVPTRYEPTRYERDEDAERTEGDQ